MKLKYSEKSSYTNFLSQYKCIWLYGHTWWYMQTLIISDDLFQKPPAAQFKEFIW